MADPKLFITDASVLLKWVTREKEYLEQALLLEDNFREGLVDIAVPAHCYYEICNMLGREYRHKAITFLSYLIMSEITEYRLTLELASHAFLLIRKYSRISFYDASYHVLALQEQGTFITADAKYYRKTHKEGHIMLLKDYGKKSYAGR